jgi:molybdopterin molybdotransferase
MSEARGAAQELDLGAALDRIAPVSAGANPSRAMHRVTLALALQRVLAVDLIADRDLPGENISAMDGFALRAADSEAGRRLALRGSLLAGAVGLQALEPGCALRIMTGARVPPGADAVAPFEDMRAQDPDSVTLIAAVAVGANIRHRGEHVRAGEAVLRAGDLLSPAALGLAATLGFTEVDVRARLRVGVFSTGNELRDAPCATEPGLSLDGNRPMLLATLERAGFEATDLGICADEPGVLACLVDAAAHQGIEILVTTGGAAMGDADARGLGPEGRLRLLGLPGNPVAAWMLLHLLVLPALQRLSGARAAVPVPLQVRLGQEARVRAGRIDLRRAVLVQGEGGVEVRMVEHQGSAMVRGLCEADAIVAIGPQPQLAAGEYVPTWLLRALEP